MSADPYTTRLTVKPEWIDHNGHLNLGYFIIAFDEATDAVYEQWGLGLDYPDVSGCSVFTLGMNADYLGELFEAEPIRIETQLVDCDSKRIHYFHHMYNGDTGNLVARNECLCMNVRLDSRKSEPFPESIVKKLSAVHTAHSAHGIPEGFGRSLQIRR
jgi:acyl-CoA thioester hydrolase